MNMLDIPIITQEHYDKLYDASDVITTGRDITYFTHINRVLNKLLIQSRGKRGSIKNDKFMYSDRMFGYIYLGSFNMNKFLKEKDKKPQYLKIDFHFPGCSIDDFKENLKTDHINTTDYIPFLVNPKLLYHTNSYGIPNINSVLGVGYMHKTHSEEKIYNYIKSINDVFETLTGEVLFFRV